MDNHEEYQEHEDELDSEEEDAAYEDSVLNMPDPETVAKVSSAFNRDGTVRKIVKASKSDFVHNLLYLDGQKFSFAGREYLQPLYNRNDKRVMLKTGRQVEKCLIKSTRYLRFDGSEITVADLSVGDKLISFDDSFAATVDTVKSLSPNGVKPVVRITTKKKRSVTCTLNHPFRTLLDWADAGDLKVGDFIGLPHKAGEFGTVSKPTEAEFLGLMIAEGICYESSALFTQAYGECLDRFLCLTEQLGHKLYPFAVSGRPDIARVNVTGQHKSLLEILADMSGRRSADHTIPDWIFQADRDTARAFICGLWAGDGHCKNVRDGKIDLCFGSISKQLVEDLSRLLLKFGVLSTTRENKPTLYKGTDKVAYILRIIGARSLKRFHDDIGPIPGKPFTLEKSCGDKDQSDVIPKEIGKLIKAIIKERGPRKHGDTLHSKGLKSSPYFNLQRDKFLRYCEVLDDQRLWDIYNADIYWDAIESIEELPPEETIAVEMETFHNFVTDGIITHNSTALANNLVVSSVIEPYSKSLYVSPSHMQTRQFSNEKLRPAIEKSPLIAKYFQDSSVSSQVFEKGFTNGSYIFLRSAFRSADRCVARGTRITLADGTVKKVEALAEGDLLLSTPGGNGLTERPCRKVWSNGVKPVAEVTLQSGQSLRASLNHRWLTHKGIVETSELEGKWVPIPLSFFTTDVQGDDAYNLLGFFLGDGCTALTKNGSPRVEFNNNDLEIIGEFERVALSLGLDTARYTRTRENGKLNYNVRITSKQKAYDLLEQFGVLGKYGYEKYIPECVFGSIDRTRRVLRGMFDSDGWATFSTKNNQYEIGWVSGSKQLAQDLQYCLQGLGVQSFLREKQPTGRQKSVSYDLKIRGIEQIRVFAEKVGFLCSRKSAVLDEMLRLSEDACKIENTAHDCPARDDVNAALEAAGISDHSLWADHRISWRRNSSANGERVSSHKVRRIYELTGHEGLCKYLSPHTRWVQVKSVTPAGGDQVYDLSVEVDEMFVANGVLTHNTRGIAISKYLCIDEVQDFIGSEIPVILECTSHYPDACVIMAGTPKSHDNPIEMYWKETSQNEWLVPCSSCGKWNFLDEKNIAPTEWYVKGKLPPGPICKKCMKPINVRDGRWVATSENRGMIGYRIPQLMVPWIVGLSEQWAKLLWKRDNYPFGQFCNEALGLSYDSASKPVTRDEIISCCDDYDMWDASNLTDNTVFEAHKHLLTAGVDWGEGNDGSEKGPGGKTRNASYTVLTIGTYVDQKHFHVKLVKKYMGRETDPDYVVKDIADICARLRVKLIGVDWGHGWGVNNLLVRRFGAQNVIQFQYLPKLKQRMKWDPTGFRYHLQRNFMMSEMFFDIKQGYVRFPRWAQTEPYAKDILAIYSEYSEYRREIKYDHKSSDPDDWFHSLHYCKLASDIMLGKSRRYTQEIIDKDGP
jgi:intein/homing endonuclease